jgi:NAD(P)H-flavin reductase
LFFSAYCNVKGKITDQIHVLEEFQILRCGPPPMNKAMAAHLEALEYAPEMQFQF